MAEARGRMDWAQTAELLCVLYNANRDPARRARPFTAADFDPYRRAAAKAAPKADMSLLKQEVLTLASVKGKTR